MMFSNIYRHDQVDSTNVIAKKLPYNSVAIADAQTKGKGRFERGWSSGKGGIYLSIVLKTTTNTIQHYTFIAALAVFKALYPLTNKSKIKWPNDILINRKKVCGILTENVFFKDSKKSIIGIGINTNNMLPKTLEKTATTLLKETNKKINNKKIINSILKNIEFYIQTYNQHGFLTIKKEWLKNADLVGQKLRIEMINKTIFGVGAGVDDQCRLLVKTTDDKIVKVIEGDMFYQS